MEEDDEWKKVSDADCMAFLLTKLPENLKHINDSLKGTLLQAEDESNEVQ